MFFGKSEDPETIRRGGQDDVYY